MSCLHHSETLASSSAVPSWGELSPRPDSGLAPRPSRRTRSRRVTNRFGRRRHRRHRRARAGRRRGGRRVRGGAPRPRGRRRSSSARSRKSTASASSRCERSSTSPIRASTRSSRRRGCARRPSVAMLQETLVGGDPRRVPRRLDRPPHDRRRPRVEWRTRPRPVRARSARQRYRGVATRRRGHDRTRRPRGRVARATTRPASSSGATAIRSVGASAPSSSRSPASPTAPGRCSTLEHQTGVSQTAYSCVLLTPVRSWRERQPSSATCSTNFWSWRRLRHSKTPSQKRPYSDTIESPVSQ